MVQTLAASGHLTTSPSDPHRDNSFPRPSSWPCRRDFFRSTLRRHSAALQAAGIARARLKTRVQLQHLPINLRGQKAQLDYGVQLESRRSAAEQVLGRLYFWPTIGLTLLRSWRDGRGLWCEVDDTVLLGVAPLAILQHPAQLQALGVRGVVNLCDEYGGPQASYDRMEITQLRLPTVDHYEPSLEDLLKAVEFIEKFRQRGHKVYVHCKAGHGRAAAVALSWMIFTSKAHGEEAVRELNANLAQKRRVRGSLYRQANIRAFMAKLEPTGPGLVASQDTLDCLDRELRRRKTAANEDT